MSEDRYVFIVEWFDSAAALVRTYNLTYYLKDNTIDMYDLKNKRTFLKRCQYAGINLKDIFIGAILTIYSRQLKVIDFADQFTRNHFEKQRGKTLALVKPDAYLDIGKIINVIEEQGFTIGNMKMVRMSEKDCEDFYAMEKGKPHYSNLTKHLASDLVVALELIADNCVNKWNQLVGPEQNAKSTQPNSLRAKYGAEGFMNVAHGSSSVSAASKELQFFFSNKSRFSTPACFSNCSCMVIKPHVLTDGYVGQVLDTVLGGGFEISALQMFWLDRPSAEQFLQVYKNVVPEYNQLVEELTSGPCVALEVRQDNVVSSLRQLCGPHDPEMARTVRPRSLRAIYGKDKAKNAVHCTDLIEDGLLEVEYFFNILQK